MQKISVSDSGATTNAEDILKKHKGYYEELQENEKGLIHVTKGEVPTLFTDNGELKSQDKWTKDCKVILHKALEVSKSEESTLDKSFEDLEKIVTMEIPMRNAIEDADTHLRKDYLDHITRFHLWIARA